MERVLNLPLRASDYRAVTEGEVRRILLPETPRTRSLLFGKDDAPRPYTRVNVRLGASGAPQQFALVGYGCAERAYYITLGEPIREVDDETWAATIEAAFVALIIDYLESVRGYGVAYGASEYKRLSRQSRDLVETYERVCQYTEVGSTVGGAARELATALKRELIQIWRGCHHAIVQLGAKTYTDMQAEASWLRWAKWGL